MINDDILIKYSTINEYGGYGDWVTHVKYLSAQIRDIRDNDFTGIGLSDLSLVTPMEVKVGQRIILCDYLDRNGGDPGCASILGLILRINPRDPWILELEVEGIGRRPDLNRDPERKLRWGSKIYPDLRRYPTLLRLDTKPKPDGGAVYYYYSKAPRDSRINYVPGSPEKSREAILGVLRGTAYEDISGVRPRAQYMHTYRRVAKEIRSLLGEVGEDKLLEDLWGIIKNATSAESKEISKKVWERTGNISKN